MLYRQLQYFVSVVDLGSFTEAAEQNYISQSAISQQIKALEKELGVELIVRENRKFHLTAAGEHFYRHVKTMLRELEDEKKELLRLSRGEMKQLRIGYLNYYNGEELHHAIAEFSKVHPEVADIKLKNGTHEERRELLRLGEVDIILMEQRRAFSELYVNYELQQCDCYVDLSIRNRLSAEDCVSLDELRGIPCILVASQEQQATERDFYENALGFGKNIIFVENLDEARLLINANRGHMPVDIVGEVSQPYGMIVRKPLYQNGSIVQRNYCAFWAMENNNELIKVFVNILHDLLRK